MGEKGWDEGKEGVEEKGEKGGILVKKKRKSGEREEKRMSENVIMSEKEGKKKGVEETQGRWGVGERRNEREEEGIREFRDEAEWGRGERDGE